MSNNYKENIYKGSDNILFQPIFYILNKNNTNELFLNITEEVVHNIKPWYYISDHRNVFSYNSNRLMKLTESADGYNVFTARTMDEKGITLYVHRIEMLVFKYEIGCENLSIDHIDCYKKNNIITNLEWVTTAENTRRASKNGLLLTGEDAPWTKVSDEKVHDICKLYIRGYGITSISRMLNCGIDSVFRVVHGIGRRNVSSLYDIESRYRGYLTDDQIHKICRIFESNKGIEYSRLKSLISNTLNININRNIDCIIRNIYRHDVYCYYRISSLYNY